MACCESADSSKGSLESDCHAEFPNSCAAAMEKEYLSPTETSTPSLQVDIQGYDVEFDPPLESKYECPICLMALRCAVQTPCGHRFCRNCIEKSIRYPI